MTMQEQHLRFYIKQSQGIIKSGNLNFAFSDRNSVPVSQKGKLMKSECCEKMSKYYAMQLRRILKSTDCLGEKFVHVTACPITIN